MYFLVYLKMLTIVLAFILGGCGDAPETELRASARSEKTRPPVEEPAPELLSTQRAFIEVSQKVTPAVVNISATRTARAHELGPRFEEFFGNLFKDPRESPRPKPEERSLGSGFILTEDGYILTNEHVVKGGGDIRVRLSDQSSYEARVVGVDERTDVAVLKIEAKESLPTVVLGDSDQLQVGQWALAIGNPFGLDRTLTVGVISATGRSNIGIEEYEDFIQTDASINPGNSGGPLLNIYGEVVGINTAIVASGQGIGFAIPVNLARLIADQLIETGTVTRGWLGVGIQPVTRDLAESFGLDRTSGALVNRVMENTPAAEAGLRRGDIILSFNGRQINGVGELQLLVASARAGSDIELEVLRDGKRRTLSVTLAAREGMQQAKKAAEPERPVSEQWLGLSVEPFPQGAGVRVKEVERGSIAAAAGVRSGDLILSLNQQDVGDLSSWREAVKKTGSEDNIVFLVQRGEHALFLAAPGP